MDTDDFRETKLLPSRKENWLRVFSTIGQLQLQASFTRCVYVYLFPVYGFVLLFLFFRILFEREVIVN